MILIADSGSTKTEWYLLTNGAQETRCITKGINPFYQSSADILQNLKEEYTLNNAKPQAIHFYGAGCANEEKNSIVKQALIDFFGNTHITINSDLMGAARSLCQDEQGIACILGTGSNSCYYDGQSIIRNVSPLGFIIGDEGSGAVLGKKLIADILKNQLPKEIIQLFFSNYNTTPAEILENIYKKPFPNRYLAQYTRFLSENIHLPELERLVVVSFREFIERNLLQYDNIKQLPISFTGSIAYHFKEQLTQALSCYNLQPATINQAPMSGLIAYHNELKY